MKHSDQVTAALKALHPGVRRDIRRALDAVETGAHHDSKALQPPLDGFFRLRVGKYRVIYHRNPETGVFIAEFLDLRANIYEAFQPPA